MPVAQSRKCANKLRKLTICAANSKCVGTLAIFKLRCAIYKLRKSLKCAEHAHVLQIPKNFPNYNNSFRCHNKVIHIAVSQQTNSVSATLQVYEM